MTGTNIVTMTWPTFSFLLYHKTDTYVFEKFIYVIRETEILLTPIIFAGVTATTVSNFSVNKS